MKKTHRELQEFIKKLPHPHDRECRAVIQRPLVSLAERILSFVPPFEHLRHESGGFDPLVRFLLNRAESGDPLAKKAMAEMIVRSRILHCAEPVVGTPTDYWGEFFTENKQAWNNFHRLASPWLFTQASDPKDLEGDPAVDSELDTAVLENLGAFGFRRLARSFQTDVLGEPLVIKWDKGTWSINMSMFLEIRHRHLFVSLGAPFSSGACFDFRVPANVGPRLRVFFRVLKSVFPYVLQALSEGIESQDRWLAEYRRGAA